MPSPFEITTPSNTVAIDNKREGTATFTVRNITRRRVRGVAKIEAQPPAAAWIKLSPAEGSTPNGADDARDFPIDGVLQYQVRVAAPADAPPGAYHFKLRVAEEINPDDNVSSSGDIQFTLVPPVTEEKRKLPSWVFLVIIAVVVLVGGIIFLLVDGNARAERDRIATVTATAALELTRQAADLQTVVAATSQAATATAAAVGTQTAINVYAGNWVPVTSNPSGILGLSLTATANGQYNMVYSSRCPPAGNLCLTNPQSFSISGITYDPDRLLGLIENTLITIEPAPTNQLLVTTVVNGVSTPNVFRRERIRFPFGDIAVEAEVSTNLEAILQQNSQFQFLFQTPEGP